MRSAYVSPSPFTFQLLAKHGEEDSEVDGAGGLLQHLVDLLLLHVEATCRCRTQNDQECDLNSGGSECEKRGRLGSARLTQRSKSVPQVIFVDESVPVLVHDGEGLELEHRR